MISCYLELYEEGEVEHINGPTHAPIPYHQTMLAIAKAKGDSTRSLFIRVLVRMFTHPRVMRT